MAVGFAQVDLPNLGVELGFCLFLCDVFACILIRELHAVPLLNFLKNRARTICCVRSLGG